VVSLFIFPTGPTALDSEPHGRRYVKNMIYNRNRLYSRAIPVVYHIFDVSSSMVPGIEGYLTCWKDELGNHTLGMKAQNMHQLRVFGTK